VGGKPWFPAEGEFGFIVAGGLGLGVGAGLGLPPMPPDEAGGAPGVGAPAGPLAATCACKGELNEHMAKTKPPITNVDIFIYKKRKSTKNNGIACARLSLLSSN